MQITLGSHRLKMKAPRESQVTEIDFHGLKWIDIIMPTKADVEALGKRFDFHELLLEDCLTEHQRSKIDDFGDYCFIVLHIPRYKREIVSLESEEVDIFLGKDYLITLHEGELKPLVLFTKLCATEEKSREEYMSQGSAILLYEIIKRLFDYCFPMLDKIQIMLNDINRSLFKDTTKQMLERITRTKMQIINYRRTIKPLRPVILTLEKIISKYLPEDMAIYFDDITDKAEKIWDSLENQKEVIESINSTYSSLTDHKSNSLMAVFTILQVIILPMTLVGGLFSMNVDGIPMHSYHGAFWIVFGMILIPTAALALAVYANRRKWL